MMGEDDARRWFAKYLVAFTALGRGESTPVEVAEHFYVPFLLTTDDVVTSFWSRREVEDWLQAQADAMSSSGYDRTDVLGTNVRVENATTALVRTHMVRRRRDGSDISELSLTYVLVRGQQGLRVQALVVHPVT